MSLEMSRRIINYWWTAEKREEEEEEERKEWTGVCLTYQTLSSIKHQELPRPYFSVPAEKVDPQFGDTNGDTSAHTLNNIDMLLFQGQEYILLVSDIIPAPKGFVFVKILPSN